MAGLSVDTAGRPFDAVGQLSQDGACRLDFVANGHAHARTRGQIDVAPRSEPDKTIALAAIQRTAALNLTKYMLFNKTRNLHQGYLMLLSGMDVHGFALYFSH